MRKTAVFKMFVVRVVTLYVLFCAVVPCLAQETARGIVAEKIGAAPIAECPDLELRFQGGHSDNVSSVSWSPDGKYIASNDGIIKIWDAENGKEIRVLSKSNLALISTWSPDSKYIATGDGCDVKIYNVINGRNVHTLIGHSSKVVSVAWSPDGKYIASACENTVRVWDIASMEELRIFESYCDWRRSIAWSPDSKYIASGTEDGMVKIGSIANGNEEMTLTGHSSYVHSVSWSPDGKYIASASSDNSVKIWDAINRNEVKTLLGSEASSRMMSVSWSPDGKYIACGGYKYTVTVWNSITGDEIVNFCGTEGWNSVAWSPDGKFLAYCCYDRAVRIRDVINEKDVITLSGHSNSVKSVAWSPNRECIAIGSNPDSDFDCGTLKILNMKNENKMQVLHGYSMWSNIAWSPDGKYIAGGSNDNTVKIWDVESGKETINNIGHSELVCSVAWSPEGKYVASGSRDNTVKIWDAESGKEVRTLSGHSKWVNSVSWSPDGRYIVSGSYDYTVKIWDAESGKEVRTLSGHSKWVNSVSWSPDGKYIASGSDTTIWDVKSGYTLSEYSSFAKSVSWSPNGKYIAGGSNDNTVKIWDVESGKEARTLSGHSSSVNSVAWSPDGKFIASGSDDDTIKIWDVQSGALLSTTINGKYGEWLTYTPEGFFCGSEWATKNLVYIVDGMDVIGIDRVYDAFYRPDVVAAKIRGEDISSYASSVQLAALVRSGSAPIVALCDIPAESSGRDMTFGVCVRNTGGGIGAVNLLLNGKAIRLSDGVASSDGETVEFRHTVTLQNGSNTLEAFALNGAGLVESVRSSAEVMWRGATEKPDLYVLTAAVNRYRDKSLWLNFAVPDAQAVAEGFQKQQSGLYRSVHVFQLNDGDVTKENLAAEFSRLSEKIRADDVFVFFVSGHGTTYDDGDYYYLPSDFRYTSKDSIPADGISKNDLLTNLSKIKAGKTLVMLDTCNSGAFVSDIGQRGLSEKTAIDRLTRATGHATLAASSDTQAAMEGYNGHGVFTYVFLEGIAGAADSDGDGYVTLNELSAFVEREVPERSYEKWGYEQVPQKDLRRQDFPIAGK